MDCLHTCGGCRVDGSRDSDEAFERELDAPPPAHCPQVIFAGGIEAFLAQNAAPKCTMCGDALDEDGRCARCAQESWIEDDRAARRDKAITDEPVSHGPEY